MAWAALDHEGSIRQLLDNSGTIKEHREYDSFGNLEKLHDVTGTSKPFDAVDSVFGFAGRELDEDTGLYYNRARWFDPKLGRFISEDPIAADINSYRYAGNNPVDFVDPSGLQGEVLMMQSDFSFESGNGSAFGGIIQAVAAIASWFTNPFSSTVNSLANSSFTAPNFSSLTRVGEIDDSVSNSPYQLMLMSEAEVDDFLKSYRVLSGEQAAEFLKS